MPRGWQWDPTLFRGSARYYVQGRLPYPAALAPVLAAALQLDGRGRLLDVGCGPGIIALRLAHLFEQAVGLDPDAEMLAEARRGAAEQQIGNARWLQALAEHLPLRPGSVRVATFAASFHWMERDRVAAAVLRLLEPGGAFVQVSAPQDGAASTGLLPHPAPPRAQIDALLRRYLGPERRAGQGVLRYGTPGDELAVLRRAGFPEPQIVTIPGGELIVRSIDDLVAAQLSQSSSAPHLFGAQAGAFEAELRRLLDASSPSGLFAQQMGDTELRIWRTPAR
ncbi:MAG TPA: class I SAM-dependent methyltransferase [Dehalococcoidia bacterium]|nr:class I SAM-dependent methyltransferase [Dehalococcoidia bacterium]